MKHLFVDFGRGIEEHVDLLPTSLFNVGITVEENERVVLYDDTIEVEAVVHQGVNSLGCSYWYAVPEWTTQQEFDITPSFAEQVKEMNAQHSA